MLHGMSFIGEVVILYFYNPCPPLRRDGGGSRFPIDALIGDMPGFEVSSVLFWYHNGIIAYVVKFITSTY